MKGWKTWAGAAILGISAVAEALGYGFVGNILFTLGAAFGIVGIGHKIEKTGLASIATNLEAFTKKANININTK